MKYICANEKCKCHVEANSLDIILIREKLCKKCFMAKYWVTETIRTRTKRINGILPEKPMYKYMCFDCGSISPLLKNNPCECKSCNSLAMFKTYLIQD